MSVRKPRTDFPHSRNYRMRILTSSSLDVMMPGLDGFETLERIRKTSEIPVIMLTARSEEYGQADRLLASAWTRLCLKTVPGLEVETDGAVGAVLKRNRKTPSAIPLHTENSRSGRIPASPPSLGKSSSWLQRNLICS